MPCAKFIAHHRRRGTSDKMGYYQVVLVADGETLEDVRGTPLARAPVVAVALLDQEVERSDRFLQRSAVVEAVAEYDVSVLLLESLQGLLDALDHVLSRKSDIVLQGERKRRRLDSNRLSEVN